MYLQADGIAMSSPLAPTFAEFYMCNLENQLLTNNKPDVYSRYVEDIYVVIDSENQCKNYNELWGELSFFSGITDIPTFIYIFA